MPYHTYPHDAISEKCHEKYPNKWDSYECIINSLKLYYKKIKKDEIRDEKFVELNELRT